MPRRIFFKETNSLPIPPSGISVMGFNQTGKLVNTDESGIVYDPSTLVIDGNVNEFYKYGGLGYLFGGSVRLPYSKMVIKDIEGTPNLHLNAYLLQSLTFENCQITNLTVEAPQLTSLVIPSGLTILNFV